MGKKLDLTGQRFGRLVAIKYAYTKRSRRFWRCKCDCGNEKTVEISSLMNGKTKSCGCLNRETFYRNPYTMRHTHMQLYNVWHGIKLRCHNPNYHSFEFYGGRGIIVCDEWRNSFDTFATWADNNGYEEGLEIDRIDVNGNYCPENCRWVTPKQQANNRRNTFIVTYQGAAKPLSEWCDELGLPYATIYYRLSSGKWSVEDALNVPVRHYIKSDA